MNKRKIIGFSLIASTLLFGSMGVYAVMLFTQNFPSVTTLPIIQSNCGNPATLAANSTLAGANNILYSCGSTSFAFVVSAGGTASYTISSSSGVNAIFLVQTPLTTQCPTVGPPGGRSLPSLTGGSITFNTGTDNNYDYCVSYASPGSQPSFTITWSQ